MGNQTTCHSGNREKFPSSLIGSFQYHGKTSSGASGHIVTSEIPTGNPLPFRLHMDIGNKTW